MSRLKISENKKNFTREEKEFFYLADTIWSAFTNVTMEEWEYYLTKRSEEGFTVLQINTLPQWDRCMSDVGVYPFAIKDGQKFDFSQYDEAYYTRAKEMCQRAVDYGFQLALVVMWLNYVPGTWGSKITDINVMPKEYVKGYAEKVVDEFDEFDPIYIISGDTDFDTSEAIEYYGIVLDAVSKKSPDSIKTCHIKRGYDYVPEQFLDRLDFMMFQSGHNIDGQDMAYILPEKMQEKYPGKPLINAEPCYEQMGYSRQKYGRFGRRDIRKAAWSSILAGACAGITYGAHGIWNWKKEGMKPNPILGEGFDESFPMHEALQFQGALDYGYIKKFLAIHHITEVNSAQHILLNQTPEIRVGETPDGKILIYIPYTTTIRILADLKGCQGYAVDLETGKYADCAMFSEENNITAIKMHCFEHDAIIVLER